MTPALKRFIAKTPIYSIVRRLLGKPEPVAFNNTEQYWEARYRADGNSGAGSYGRLAEFKAETINDFVASQQVLSVVEFGCGDGHQLTLAKYPQYLGVDISQRSIEICREVFATDPDKSFIHSSDYQGQTAELALSLDVIYHLIEDSTFNAYMTQLFKAAERFVIIYACNFNDPEFSAVHVKPRKFTDWVEANQGDFELSAFVQNRYPWEPKDPDNTSFADFYIYKRIG